MIGGTRTPARTGGNSGGIVIGRVTRVTAEGPYVELVRNAAGFEVGPLLTAEAGLEVGDTAVLMALAHDPDGYVVLGRQGGTTYDDVYAPLVHDHDGRYYTEAETDAAIADAVDAAGGGIPIGAELTWSGPLATIPLGWFIANGAELRIADYPTAYARLTNNGTVFPHGANTNGAGAAGTTHFRLPNRKGRVIVGQDPADVDFDVIGETGGAKTVTLTVAQMPSHNHTQTAHNHPWRGVNDGAASSGAPGTYPIRIYQDRADNWSGSQSMIGTVAPAIQNTGGDQAHPNLQPYSVAPIIVKIHDVNPDVMDYGPDAALDLVGDVKWTAAATLSSKWKKADGTVLVRAEWPQLFDRIGTAFNIGGETSAQFRLPNLTDRVPLGSSGTRARGTMGGAETHTLTTAQIPGHLHSGTTGNMSANATHRHQTAGRPDGGSVPDGTYKGGIFNYGDGLTGFTSTEHTHAFTTDAGTGGNGAHNNMQPYTALNAFVRALP